jgi:hypothetical protein
MGRCVDIGRSGSGALYLSLLGHTLHREPAGSISHASCWVLQYGAHLHIHSSLPGLLWEWLRERGHDRHLVG